MNKTALAHTITSESIAIAAPQSPVTLVPPRIAANRQNALNSTGPITVAGKQKSRWNAVRHGLLSKEVIVPIGDSPENRKSFVLMHTALHMDFNPVGTIEEMLVERIAISYWRLSRCVRAESGEIARESAGTSTKFYRNMADEVESIEDRIFRENLFSSYRKTSFGLKYVIQQLELIREKIEMSDDFDDKEFQKLIEMYGRKERSLPFRLKVLALIGEQQRSKGNQDSPQRKKRKPSIACKVMLETIDDEIKRCNACLEQVTTAEDGQLSGSIKSAALPSPLAMDKILRYESAIERQLYKALDQLERLQRHRKGDFVPPPAQLGVSLET